MSNEKSVTLNGLSNKHILHIILSVAMLGVCIYLTSHYFQVLFPTADLSKGSSLCDINSFFNCDTATHSKASNVFGIPISFFGIIFSLSLIAGSIFPSKEQEQTNKFLATVNLFGCIALFLFSILVLKSLCPFCTVYYILSGFIFFLLFKSDVGFVPSAKPLIAWGIVAAIGGFIIHQNISEKETKANQINNQIIAQFEALDNLGDPTQDSPYRIHSGTEKFSDTPVRVSVFSDFQCPFCKMVAEDMGKLGRIYKDKLNIQYFFYPLDNACNEKIKSKFHEFACRAAHLAACDPKQFGVIHDEIFENQESLSFELLDEMAKKKGMSDCFEKAEAKNAVLMTIKAAEQFNLRSTPTIIINGKKIEGYLKTNQMRALFDHLIEKGK